MASLMDNPSPYTPVTEFLATPIARYDGGQIWSPSLIPEHIIQTAPCRIPLPLSNNNLSELVFHQK